MRKVNQEIRNMNCAERFEDEEMEKLIGEMGNIETAKRLENREMINVNYEMLYFQSEMQSVMEKCQRWKPR